MLSTGSSIKPSDTKFLSLPGDHFRDQNSPFEALWGILLEPIDEQVVPLESLSGLEKARTVQQEGTAERRRFGLRGLPPLGREILLIAAAAADLDDSTFRFLVITNAAFWSLEGNAGACSFELPRGGCCVSVQLEEVQLAVVRRDPEAVDAVLLEGRRTLAGSLVVPAVARVEVNQLRPLFDPIKPRQIISQAGKRVELDTMFWSGAAQA